VELAALTKAKGLVTAIGLQARVNPAVMHLKDAGGGRTAPGSATPRSAPTR
jgi:hypothetical protein